MQKHKILYVASTSRGGSAFSLYHLVTGIDRCRYEPVVLFYVEEHPYIGDRLRQMNVTVINLDGARQEIRSSESSRAVEQEKAGKRNLRGWLEAHFGRGVGQAYFSLRSCWQFIRRKAGKVGPIFRVIRQNRIDLVHVNTGLLHGQPAIVAAYLARVPCVCHVRMFSEFSQFDKIFIRFVKYFVYISNAVAAHFANQGVPPEKGTVVHNAVDLSLFSRSYDVALLRQEFRIALNDYVVGVIGRLDWWKGHEYFLRAMAEVIRKMAHVRGLIIGEPENSHRNRLYFQNLRSLVSSLGIEREILFTGFRSDVPQLMAALDIIVLCSSSPEPFGRVVIEGMAASKPVIATSAGGVLDIIAHGRTGLLVPCKDSTALARAILQLLNDREQARQIGLAARQCVERNFTLAHHVHQIQKLYDRVLGRGPRRRRAAFSSVPQAP